MQLCDRSVGSADQLFFIAGPCVIESEAHALKCAEHIRGVALLTGALFIYKSSFDKANRSSVSGFRGPGIDEGLRILEKVRSETGLPVITDVHDSVQARAAAQVCDVLQTPALLCRQTDFIQGVAAAAQERGRAVNIKKGQFMAPDDMANVVDKCAAAGLEDVMLCERGTSFGYHNLVVDMRGLDIMAQTGRPVVFDATHSVQLPGAKGTCSGGERQFVPLLARAAVAARVAGVFLETHPEPDQAPCDGPNAWPLELLAHLCVRLLAIDATVKIRCK